jgi:hypothetical protein
MRTIDELKERCPPPTRPIEPGIEDSWPDVQGRVGSVLPRDYKDFINAYGTLFWLTVDQPDQWAVVIKESRSPTYEHFPGSMTEFLQAFLARSLETEIFPDDFCDEGPAIVRCSVSAYE